MDERDTALQMVADEVSAGRLNLFSGAMMLVDLTGMRAHDAAVVLRAHLHRNNNWYGTR